MFRSLFSIGAIFSLLFVSLGVPAANAARKRCPEEPPSTLLSLFKRSDAVYIGKFDKTADGEVTRTDEDSKTVSVSEHFSISNTVKGESRKFFVRTYDAYRYTGSAAAEVETPDAEEVSADQIPEVEAPEEEFEDDSYRSLKPGDNVMLFLRYVEEGDGEEGVKKGKRVLDLTHYRDGIKRLEDTELSSYEARVKELKGILSKKNGNDADVLNWLIRCIDDPVTRWEGAFELHSSFQNLDWKERRKAEEQESAADEAGAENESADEVVEEEIAEEDDEFDNSVYAGLLTDAQKTQLMSIAISSKSAKADEKTSVRRDRDGDRVLFDVVKRWGDSKLAAAMLDRLRGTGEDNYEKHNWMSSIAEVLKDKELSSISEKFSNATYQDDDEEFDDTKDKVEDEVIDGPAVEPEESEESEETSGPATEEGSVDTVEKADKKTYKQYRDELFADFIGKATALISQEKEKAVAKTNAK